jgi:hypothetical protein
MKDKPLPKDVCRCHADVCCRRLSCQRWLQRDVQGMVPHSILTDPLQPKGPCRFYRKSEGQKP